MFKKSGNTDGIAHFSEHFWGPVPFWNQTKEACSKNWENRVLFLALLLSNHESWALPPSGLFSITELEKPNLESSLNFSTTQDKRMQILVASEVFLCFIEIQYYTYNIV